MPVLAPLLSTFDIALSTHASFGTPLAGYFFLMTPIKNDDWGAGKPRQI